MTVQAQIRPTLTSTLARCYPATRARPKLHFLLVTNSSTSLELSHPSQLAGNRQTLHVLSILLLCRY